MCEQKAEEQRRLEQMNFMFAQEAETFWKKQEQVWKSEQLARQQLMKDTIEGWKCQIEDKIKGGLAMVLVSKKWIIFL